jgi:hypothetical protein
MVVKFYGDLNIIGPKYLTRVSNSSPEKERSSPEKSMGPPQPGKSIISIEACARPIAVDHRISLPYYFRIAGTLLRQVKP